MKKKHRKTLEAIFKRPTQAGIPWIDIEALLINLGASISEGRDTRVTGSD